MCEKININELQNLLEEKYRKVFRIEFLKAYPLDGEFLECVVSSDYFKLYSETSFRITKGSDEAADRRISRDKWVLFFDNRSYFFDRVKFTYKDLDINKVIEKFLIEYEKQLKNYNKKVIKEIKNIEKLK